MADGAQAVVLCEGLQDWVFVRRTLIALGYEPRRIRYIPYPADGCGGSGEQHVRERYATEVRSHRSRAAKTNTLLVVHTDADTRPVQERLETLDVELHNAQLPKRSAEEAIAILIPKRNTETWIHNLLNGHAVDEAMTYPKFHQRESETWPAADAFAQYAKNGTTPPNAPPSLIRGLSETRRIL